MKSALTIAVLTAGLCLGGCATVEIMPGANEIPAAVADSTDRLALRRSAKMLSYDFAQNGWTQVKASGSKQSAAGVLLRGLKPKKDAPDTRDLYIARMPSMAAVKADIFTAQKRVRGLADDAVVTLAADPDAKALRKDLRALEKALLSAREAEITFSAALTAKGIDTPATDMREYVESVDALRSVTDALGDRSRNAVSAAATLN